MAPPKYSLHPSAMWRRAGSDDGSDGRRRRRIGSYGESQEFDAAEGNQEDLKREAVDDLEEEVEKAEKNPFDAPTAGSFYMHDDRFRECSSRGRHSNRDSLAEFIPQKVDVVDMCAWVHDRFEEMNLQDVRDDDKRRKSIGHFSGHGEPRNRGNGHGSVRGNRMRSYDETNNQYRPSRSTRGRGPRCYESLPESSSDMQYTKSHESSSSSASAGRQSRHMSNVEPDRVFPHKHVHTASVNSFSTPFYPFGSSNKEIPDTQKRDIQTGSIMWGVPFSQQVGNVFPTSQPDPSLRGKGTIGSVSQNIRYMNAPISPVTGKILATSDVKPSGSYSSLSNQTHSHSRSQWRSVTTDGTMDHQSTTPRSQITSISTLSLTPLSQKQIQIRAQSSLRISSQEMGQRRGSGTRASSPHHDPSANLSDIERTAMQFRGQQRDRGYPEISMVVSGYVAQPQLGSRNWVPVSADATGALMTSYCSPPYITLESSYNAQTSGQTSSLISSSREIDTSIPVNTEIVQEGPDTRK